MQDRQSILLREIIENYIDLAQPVGSKYLAKVEDLDLSPATIRNEMAELERAGYIAQPHTSAGRVPTLKGLRYYLDTLMQPEVLGTKDRSRLTAILAHGGLRGVARATAEYCNAATLVVRGDSDYYFTGLSNLFAEPEFSDTSLVRSIAAAVDHFETVLPPLLKKHENAEPRVYLGKENPLGDDFSFACTYSLKNKTAFGIVSPVRTHYPKNIGLLSLISEFLQS